MSLHGKQWGNLVTCPNCKHDFRAYDQLAMNETEKAFVAAYNVLADAIGIKVVKRWNRTRRTRLYYQMQKNGLTMERWSLCLKTVPDTPYLMGKRGTEIISKKGRVVVYGIRVNFDWLITGANHVKVLDGSFIGKKHQRGVIKTILKDSA